MATLRELKGRISSVASSEKITGAMKMISSAKMHKAEGALRRLKPYRSIIESIIGNLLSSDASFSSPLTETRPVQHVTVVVLGSDDGLCGAYNANLAKFVDVKLQEIRDRYGLTTGVTLVSVGKRMAKALARFASDKVRISIPAVDSKSEGDSVRDFQHKIVGDFVAGHTDAVDVIYMNYKSAGKQIATLDRILPLSPDVFAAEGVKTSARPYIFEPDAQAIFSSVLPMYILSMFQEVFIENRASEQAARVMAMQAANDNAQKLNSQLKLEFNKLRQQSITTELLDIVGGQVRD